MLLQRTPFLRIQNEQALKEEAVEAKATFEPCSKELRSALRRVTVPHEESASE